MNSSCKWFSIARSSLIGFKGSGCYILSTGGRGEVTKAQNDGETQIVSYPRVSTARQGTSGLGLEAQQAAVAEFLNGGDWTLVLEVLEVESGERNDRPALATALKLPQASRYAGNR